MVLRLSMKTPKTHLRKLATDTIALCGRTAVAFIGRNQVVDAATCRACWRADDALQLRDHERARKAAGVKPGEWF